MNVGSTYSSMAAYVMAGPCGCGGVIEGKERVLRTPKWVSGCTFMVVEHIIRIGRTAPGPVSRLTLPRGSGVGHVRLRRRAERAEYNGEERFLMDKDNDGSPPPMSAPQNQLAINLLNNLLQMQGLENTILAQQTAATTPATSPSSSPSTTQAAYNPQLLLEQQIKLTQLQQLQQLQSQIFQQQVLFSIWPFFIQLLTIRVRLPLSVVNRLLPLS